MSLPPNLPVLSAAVDELCDRFEDALQSGERPPLDSWLQDAGIETSVALPELAALDLDYRVRAGESVTAADYFRRFPQLTADAAAAVRLVGVEFRAANARESQSSEVDFRSRYPELASLPDWSNGPWVSDCAAETRLYPATPGDTPGESGAGQVEPVDFLKSFLAPPDRPADLGRLGEFHIRDVLGAGGMGVVLTADDPKLNRAVAIKLMRPEVAAKPGAKNRFLREARSAANVEHPRIVIIHHVGEWHGTPFLVMPLMAGRSLGRRQKEKPPVPLADAVRFAREAADGLAAAHAKGLIHRDIKPDNIWLEETAEGTHVRLLDFGLVHGDDLEFLAQPGAIVGTPNYMAPEQATGQPVDGRADLFSLGCVLYELLTGRKPFSGTSVIAVLSALANDRPAPVQDLASSVPGPLARLTMQLLEKNPANRPASAGAVSAELRRIEQELAVGADTVIIEASQPTSVWFHAPRWMWGVAGLFLVGVIGLMGRSLTTDGDLGSDHEYFFRDRQSSSLAAAPSPTADLVDSARKGKIVAEEAVAELSPTVDSMESLRVTAIDVRHFASTPEGDVPRGLLGRTTFTLSPGDRVQVMAQLSKPAYAYLLAFRPDGDTALCFPENENTPPPLTDTPRYPLADGQKPYRLEQGTGLWVFAVVASETPLPAYHDWVQSRFANVLSWQPVVRPPAGLVWRDDGPTHLNVFSLRGEKEISLQIEQPLEGPAATIRKLTDSLRTTGQAETVSAIGFRVAPRE